MMWNYATVEETMLAFQNKWEDIDDANDANLFDQDGDNDSLSKVESLMSDIVYMIEAQEAAVSEDATMEDAATAEARRAALQAACEARVVKAITHSHLPLEDVLLAFYRGSAIGDAVQLKTRPVLLRVFRRFLEAYPAVHIPSAFQTPPPPYRPVSGDDFLMAEENCYESCLEVMMAKHAGVPAVLPWVPEVIPAAEYREADNYLEENEEEEEFQAHPEDFPWIMSDPDCDEMLQLYTAVMLE